MVNERHYLRRSTNLYTITPAFKLRTPIKPKPTYQVGCIYTADAGNSSWHTGILIRHDKDYSIIADARGKEQVVITSTLRSIQVTI